MEENTKIPGMSGTVGNTHVEVSPHPKEDGWIVRLTTEEQITFFGISAATLELVLALMMRQGGFFLPGTRVLIENREGAK